MSLETTIARGEALAAQQKWDDHVHNCPTCSRAMGRRKPDELCRAGTAARTDKIETARELSHQRELDKQPAPSQEPLFELPEVTDGTGNAGDRQGRGSRTPR